jgi:hypothetical protein
MKEPQAIHVDLVVAKLTAEGLSKDNYTTEKAIAILDRTVAPTYIKSVLLKFEPEIKQGLS